MPRRLTALLLSTALAVAAAPAAVAAAPAPAAPEVDLQRLVERIVDAGAPGATILVRDGSSTQTFTSGVSDLRTGRVLRPDDQFRAGSVTKTFVATVVLQLVDEGVLELDSPVAAYLPRLLPDGEDITVRQLLNHTSGLFNYTADEDFSAALVAGESFRPRQLVRYGTSHDLLFPPGTDWAYSNTNYVVLGLLARLGGGIKQQLGERIFAPLELADSRFVVRNPEMKRPHAHGYLGVGAGVLEDVTTYFNPSWAWTAGALVSNDADLATFYRALLGGELLPAPLLAEMKDVVDLGPGGGYGLGLLQTDLGCGLAWGHDGLYLGYYVFALNSEDGNHQVVVMMNVDPLNGVPPADVLGAFENAVGGAFCAGEATDGELLSPSLERVPALAGTAAALSER